MIERETAKENIRRVARRLGSLRERAVFLGGSVTALLITDRAAPDIRPTKDVDIVVQTASFSENTRLEEQLRELGFDNCRDPGAPTCRWIVDDCVVDVIPVGAGANVYNDRWSPSAIKHSSRLELEEGLWIRHVSAPYFVAIKLETFEDRGEGDYQNSNDMDDIIQIIDGRPELTAEFQASEHHLRNYVSEKFREMLENDSFLDALPAHLLPEAASQARIPLLISRMKQIIRLGTIEY